MTTDKSEQERYELWKKIVKIEQREEDYLEANKKFEKSLSDFWSDFHYLSDEIDKVFEEEREWHAGVEKDFESNRQLKALITQYVSEQEDELSQTSRRVRRGLEEEREKLIKERNSLPWE